MPATTQPEQPRKKKRRIKLIWIVLITPAVIVLLLAVALAVHDYFVGRQLQQELREIADRGEPVTAADLQADYAMPADAIDQTDQWLEVIDAMKAADENPTYEDLPIIGQGDREALPMTGENWPDEPTTAKLMAELRPTFARLEELSEKPGEVRYPLDFSEGHMMPNDHAYDVSNVARFLSLRAHWQVYQGDSQGALESLNSIRQAGETLAHEKTVLSQFARIGCNQTMINKTLELLPHANWSEDQLAHLQKEFLHENVYQHTLRHMFVGERAMNSVSFSSPVVLDAMPAWYEFTRETDHLLYLRFMEGIIAASELPFAQAEEVYKAIEREIEEKTEAKFQKWRYELTSMFLPGLPATRAQIPRATVNERAAGTLIACERYRMARGNYPASLKQLVPQFLDSVPIDPYDGQPLRYLVKPKAIIVYSVGRNLVDDGGESSEEWDHIRPDMTLRLKIIEE